MNNNFDILIIGGGHAGTEAAWISSQLNLRVGLISSPDSGLASAPCNPAVGGVGKGQVVREIDALGGLMGILADRAGIQFRTLNESKGFAVQSTRVQIDKEKYSQAAEEILSKINNLFIFREMVIRISKDDDSFIMSTKQNNTYRAKKLIITTGTFLNGKLHTGADQVFGGRVSCEKSVGLNELLGEEKIIASRFKTGTPPRLDKKTIDYNKMQIQESDPGTRNFHLLNQPYNREQVQVDCYLTSTNSKTLSIIRENKEKSPIFNGQIKGIGPRYCPSIEDKAFRYTEKDIHHVFIEPEGPDLETVYPSGLSTSLPKEVQAAFIQSISGLEEAKILIYGYAVEYDVVDTTQLSQTLEHKFVPGLYFAGQVCGTSGYEEAAGLGIMAGINASLSCLEKNPLILDRNESYIGVMIEDLVTNKRDEPYRLFTARSENRLFVREDNTVLRMRKYRKELGLNTSLDQFQENLLFEIKMLKELVDTTMFYTDQPTKIYFDHFGYGPLDQNLGLRELLKRPDSNPIEVLSRETIRFGVVFSIDAIRTVAISTKYEGYIDRSIVEGERINRLFKKQINWEVLINSKNISFECKMRIKTIKPLTFGQLQRIEGIRPATLAYVAGNII